jgi:hypothetical protein
MTRARWTFAMVAALFVSVACSDQPTNAGSGPGRLVVQLTTPHGDDGAMSFQVSGPVDSVSAANGSLQLFTHRLDGSTVLGAVIGQLANGAIVTLHVPDVSAAAGYTVTALEVADREDALRASLAGYALTVTR